MAKKLLILPFIFLLGGAPAWSQASLNLLSPGLWSWQADQKADRPDQLSPEAFSPLPGFSGFQSLVPGGQGYLWLKLEFDWAGPSSDSVLLLGRLNGAGSIWCNGQKLEDFGRLPPQYFSDWNHYRLLPLLPSLVQPHNQVLVRLYVNYEGGIDGPLLIGPRHLVEGEYLTRDFFGSTVNGLIFALLLLVSAYHFLIFFKRPKERYVLDYALMGLCFAAYQTNFFVTRVPLPFMDFLPYLTFQKVIFVCMYASTFFVPTFLNRFLGLPRPQWVKWGMRGVLGLTALAFLLAQDFPQFNTLRDVLRPILFLPIAHALWLLWRGLRLGNRDASTVLFGLLPLVAGVLYDAIALEMLKVPGIYLSGLGAAAFVLSILFILAARFVNYSLEVEKLNAVLEDRVRARTLELSLANEKLETLSLTDQLTGVPNRRAFDQRYQDELARTYRTGTPLSLFMIDVDFFKKINDDHGHLIGDRCLIELGQVLGRSIRRSGDFLARFGGEEFVAILPETDFAGAEFLAKTILTEVQSHIFLIDGIRLGLSVSIGAAVFDPGKQGQAGDLVSAADSALYQAKSQGRRQACFRQLPQPAPGG